MKQLLLDLLKRKLVTDLITVFKGTVAAQGLGFVAVILVSRYLGPEEFGLFSIFLGFFFILNPVIDLGLSTSHIRLVTSSNNSTTDVLVSSIALKTMVSVAALIIALLLSKQISLMLLGSTNYHLLIVLCVPAAYLHNLLLSVQSHYQSVENFKKYSLLKLAQYGTIFLLIVAAILGQIGTDETLLILYIYGVTPVAVIALYYVLKEEKILIKWDIIKQLFYQGRWIFLSSLAVLLILRLDQFMLQRMTDSREVGYYSASLQLVGIFPLVTNSLTNTLFPKLGKFSSDFHKTRKFLKQMVKLIPVVVIVAIIIAVASDFFIPLIFGQDYIQSISIFQILCFSALWGIIVNPISLILHNLNRSQVLTVINYLQLGLNFGLNIFLIPVYLSDGAAMASLIVRIVGGILIIGITFILINDKISKENMGSL